MVLAYLTPVSYTINGENRRVDRFNILLVLKDSCRKRNTLKMGVKPEVGKYETGRSRSKFFSDRKAERRCEPKGGGWGSREYFPETF